MELVKIKWMYILFCYINRKSYLTSFNQVGEKLPYSLDHILLNMYTYTKQDCQR